MNAYLLMVLIGATGTKPTTINLTMKDFMLDSASTQLIEEIQLSETCVDLDSRLGLTGSDKCGLQDIDEVVFNFGPPARSPRGGIMTATSRLNFNFEKDGDTLELNGETETIKKRLTNVNVNKALSIAGTQFCARLIATTAFTRCSSDFIDRYTLKRLRTGGWLVSEATMRIPGIKRVIRGR